MQQSSILFQTSPPWVLKTTNSFEHLLGNLLPVLSEKKGFKIIKIDGRKMQTTSAFYEELVCALCLPNYFGRNLNALSECLSDLKWLKGIGFILVIRYAEEVLRLESPEKLEGFLDVLKAAGSEWSRSDTFGRPHPSPTPFHTIFICESLNWRQEVPLLG